MDLALIVMNIIGVVLYAITAIASSINMAAAYANGEPTYVWTREGFWSLICLLQLTGLVLINVGAPNAQLWMLNRLFWLGFTVCAVLIAYQSLSKLVRKIKSGQRAAPGL